MRMPIRVQLLLPMLTIVVFGIVLASVTGAYLQVKNVKQQQTDHLRNVVRTLRDAVYPLSERVLGQMARLSGGDFVVLDQSMAVVRGTIDISDEDAQRLKTIHPSSKDELFASGDTIEIGGRSYLIESVPLTRPAEGVDTRWLVVLYPQDKFRATVGQVALPAVFAGSVAAILAILATTLLAGRFLRPIRALGAQAELIATGRFTPAAIPSRDDEIRDLATAINRMTEKLSLYEEEVRRKEQLRALGQLGAGIAHQLRNSATGARMAIELLKREKVELAENESIDVALRQLQLIESYIQRFLTLGRSEPLPEHVPVELQVVVEEVRELIDATCRHAKIDLTCEVPDQSIVIQGDHQSLRELLLNLALNSIEATNRQNGDSRQPRVVMAIDRPSDGVARLRVMDTGPGPAEEIEKDILNPFVTNKPDGTGLGLYVASEIAQYHRGTIQWERVDDMTCFTVEIPISPDESNAK